MFTKKPYSSQLKFRCVARYYFDDGYRYERERDDLRSQGLTEDEIYDEIGAPPSAKTAEALITKSVDYTFMRRRPGEYSAGRFNSDEFAALYTASGEDVAHGERRYHWLKGLSAANPEAGYTIFTLLFSGNLRDIRAAVAAGAFEMLDADYFNCQSVAEQTRDDGLDGIVAPSKRVVSGSCCAIMTPGKVIAVDVVRLDNFAV